jgi:hypothetical protein
MAMFHVVLRQSGPEFDPARPLEEQSRWTDHAAFMDGLVEEGFIVLGGPLGDGRVVHAVEAASEGAVRARLARDPWSGSQLVGDAVGRGTIRLDGRASARRGGRSGVPPGHA